MREEGAVAILVVGHRGVVEASWLKSMSAGFQWRELPLVNNRIGSESKLMPPS